MIGQMDPNPSGDGGFGDVGVLMVVGVIVGLFVAHWCHNTALRLKATECPLSE